MCFFGGLFDLDGDGVTTPEEEYVSFRIFEEMLEDEEDDEDDEDF